jgi:hypothetical protein
VRQPDANLFLIGIETEELRWLRALVTLLRHPDPSVPELARQALLYLSGAAAQKNLQTNKGDEPYHTGPNLVS